MSTTEFAQTLRRARTDRSPCAPLTDGHDDFSVEQAYAVQRANLDRRIEEGARLVGRKVGLTSQAIQDWLGVDEPDFGGLLDDMIVDDGAVVDTSHLLQPRAEAEVAFVLGDDLGGPAVTAPAVIAATDFVVPAIEIIDSRIADWDIEYADTIADNASSGMFVVGNHPVKLDRAADLRLAGMTLRKSGRVASTGAGAACLGHPVHAVAWLANKLADFDTVLEAGQIVLSGALGPAIDVEAGCWLDAHIGHVGSVRVAFESSDAGDAKASSS